MDKPDKDNKERKIKKAQKDKDGPKRSIMAFTLYLQERKPKLKQEKPQLDNDEILKIITDDWNSLSDEKKKPFIEKAEADKKRFEAEEKEYYAKIKAEQTKSDKK